MPARAPRRFASAAPWSRSGSRPPPTCWAASAPATGGRAASRKPTEALLILKTRAELVPALIARVRQLHGYQCPAVIALPIAAGNPDYLRWIAAETRFP